MTFTQRYITSLVFVPQTHALAVLTESDAPRIDVLNADTGVGERILSPFPASPDGGAMAMPTGLAVSRDGCTLVSRDNSQALVWDVSSLH